MSSKKLMRCGLQLLAVVVSLWFCWFVLTISQNPISVATFTYQFGSDINNVRLTMFYLLLGTGILVAVFNNFVLGIGVFDALVLIFATINHFKFIFRGESFVPSDLIFAQDAGQIVNMVSPMTIVPAVLGIVLFVAALLFVNHRLHKHTGRPFRRVWTRVAVLVVCVLPWTVFLHSNESGTVSASILHTYYKSYAVFIDRAGIQKLNGPLINFLNNIDVAVMDKPTGYSEQQVRKITRKYSKLAAEINQQRQANIKNQTVIYVLSESLANPKRLPFLKLNIDPLKNIDAIKDQNPAGLMMSSGYGGGTANMEYMALTSFEYSQFGTSVSTPYPQFVYKQKNPASVTDLFNHKTAIHPYYSTLYSRAQVYKQFNFSKFTALDTSKTIIKTKIGSHPYVSDAASFANVNRQLHSFTKGQFIQLATMQNHMPYTTDYPNKTVSVSGTGLAAATKASITKYADGITYTDKAVAKWLKQLDALQRPITVVFYGDHLPSVYSTSMQKQYAQQLHETDYFIYSNKAARKTARNVRNTKITSPNYFTAMMLERANAKVSPFYAMMTQLQHKVPAMSSITSSATSFSHAQGTQYTRANGRSVDGEAGLTKTQKRLIRDYKIIQYDQTAGANYARSAKFYELGK